MSTTTRFRIPSTGAVGVLALVILALLPAAAHSDDGGDIGCIDTATAEPGGGEGGGGSEGGGSEESSGSDAPVSSDGDATEALPGDGEGAEELPPYPCYGEGQPTSGGGGWGGDPPESDGGGEAGAGGETRAHAAAAVDCGGTGGPGGSGAGVLEPDSDTAGIDVDAAAVELDSQWFSQWFSSRAVAAGAGSRRAAVSDCVRDVALVGGLDDGVVAPTRIDAGAGGAAASADGPALGIAITTLMGAVFEVLRRRRR